MADRVRVTVAPGAHITITPHPSGLAVLKDLTLFGGNTADVSPTRAAALYAAGLILDPVTGALPPIPEAMAAAATVPTISHDGGPFLPADNPLQAWPNWSATAAMKAPEPGIPPNPDAPRPSVAYHGANADPSLASITDAAGRAWPSF